MSSNAALKRARRRFAFFALFVAVTGAIALARGRDLLPLTPAAIGDSIRGWGPAAPLLFAGIFVLRPFIFFPSTLLFLAGGLAFGVGWGTFYSALGGTLGAVIGFTIARMLGYEFVQAQFGERLPDVQHARWGVGLVFLLNLIPVVPMTAINYGAGLSGMEVLPFTMAVLCGLTPRAFAYSFFGHSLLHVRSKEFVAALALLVVLLVIPLYIRRHLNRRAAAGSVPPAG